MRLIFIANDFPSVIAPTRGMFNLNLARALARKHSIRVIAPIPWTDELRAWHRGHKTLDGHRRIEREGIEIVHPRYYFTPRMLRSRYGAFYWRSVQPCVEEMIRREPPDAVIGYWAHPDGEAAVRTARLAHVPSAIILGGSDVLLLTKDPSRRRCVLDAMHSADALITVNRHLKRQVMAMGILEHKIHVWQQGIDPAVFHPGDRAAARSRLGLPSGGKILVWVGRLVPVKGLDILMRACAILRKTGHVFHLYLLGDGPLRGQLEKQVAHWRLEHNVYFIGSTPQKDLADWYRAADLTVLPSRSEGLPNVLRESVACGTPFVASDVGGISEIADPRADRLVPAGNDSALAAAIATALDHPAKIDRPRLPNWNESASNLVEILESTFSEVAPPEL